MRALPVLMQRNNKTIALCDGSNARIDKFAQLNEARRGIEDVFRLLGPRTRGAGLAGACSNPHHS